MTTNGTKTGRIENGRNPVIRAVAHAAYGDRYQDVENEAKRAGRGMWGHSINIDPGEWRNKNREHGHPSNTAADLHQRAQPEDHRER